MHPVTRTAVKVAIVFSLLDLPAAIGAKLAAIWTDSDHWADTAALLWVLLVVAWVIVFFIGMIMLDDD